jgi:putative nucleotidyltransferase with HDIG domain
MQESIQSGEIPLPAASGVDVQEDFVSLNVVMPAIISRPSREFALPAASFPAGLRPMSFQIGNGPQAGIALTELEKEIIASAPFARLDSIRQFTIFYSERGRGLSHSRYEHSVFVLENADLIAQKLGLGAGERELVRLAALLHDIGHTPFSHAGEDIAATFDPGQPFDHDEHGLGIIRGGEIGAILRARGVDPEDVALVLDDSGDGGRYGHLRFLVKECADRFGYLVRDFQGTDFSRELKEKVKEVVLSVYESLYIENGRVYVTDTAPMAESLALRNLLYQEYSAHPVGRLTREVLRAAVGDLLARGALTLQQFIGKTDGEVMGLFEEKYQRWLLDGVDRSFVPAGAVQFSSLTVEGQSELAAPDFQESLQKEIEGLIPGDRFFLIKTPEYGKRVGCFLKHENGVTECRVLNSPASPDSRFLYLVVDRDVEPTIGKQISDLFAARTARLLRADAEEFDRAQLFGNRSVECF